MYISSCYVELLLVLYTTAMLDSFCAKYNIFWTWSIVRVNIIIKITFDGGIRAIPWIRCRSKKLNDSGCPVDRKRGNELQENDVWQRFEIYTEVRS